MIWSGLGVLFFFFGGGEEIGIIHWNFESATMKIVYMYYYLIHLHLYLKAVTCKCHFLD